MFFITKETKSTNMSAGKKFDQTLSSSPTNFTDSINPQKVVGYWILMAAQPDICYNNKTDFVRFV